MLIFSILASWSRWQVWLPWAPFLGRGSSGLFEEWYGYASSRNGILEFPAPFHFICLGFCTMHSTLEHMPNTGAMGWGHLAGSQWESSCAPSCPTGVVWVWLHASRLSWLLRWRHGRTDISGLFECLPEAKWSVSTAEVDSACSKSRAQLISRHRAPLGAGQRKSQNHLGHWLRGSPSQGSPPNAPTLAVWLRQVTPVLSLFPDYSPRQTKISAFFLGSLRGPVQRR